MELIQDTKSFLISDMYLSQVVIMKILENADSNGTIPLSVFWSEDAQIRRNSILSCL
jgi:predicted HAD superfamily hydrolase